MLVFVDVPSEALSLQGFSQHLPSKQEKSLEPDAVVLCLLPCFLPWVQAGNLLTPGTGQNVCQGDSDFNKMFLGRIFCVLGVFCCCLLVCLRVFCCFCSVWRWFFAVLLWMWFFLFFFSFACIKIWFSHLHEKTEHLKCWKNHLLCLAAANCLYPHLHLLCPPLIQSQQRSCFHLHTSVPT